MNKLIGASLVILGFFSVASAQDVPSNKWTMTCQITQKKVTPAASSSYMVSGHTISRTRLAGSNMEFEAYVREKTQVNPVTWWIKKGEPELVINVAYKGIPVSNVVGKGDALSITRLNGYVLSIGCSTKKN